MGLERKFEVEVRGIPSRLNISCTKPSWLYSMKENPSVCIEKNYLVKAWWIASLNVMKVLCRNLKRLIPTKNLFVASSGGCAWVVAEADRSPRPSTTSMAQMSWKNMKQLGKLMRKWVSLAYGSPTTGRRLIFHSVISRSTRYSPTSLLRLVFTPMYVTGGGCRNAFRA